MADGDNIRLALRRLRGRILRAEDPRGDLAQLGEIITAQLRYHGPIAFAVRAQQHLLGGYVDLDMMLHVSCDKTNLEPDYSAFLCKIVSPDLRSEYGEELRWRDLDRNLAARPADTHIILAFVRDQPELGPVGYQFFRYPPTAAHVVMATGTGVREDHRGRGLCGVLGAALWRFLAEQGHEDMRIVTSIWWLNHVSRRAHHKIGYGITARRLTLRLGSYRKQLVLPVAADSRWRHLR